ncbi:MAG: UMP kinase [Candidatus Methanoliparum thermophilum]|uniref:Uridylate kinase n=2 Tax=Candidatus Methanoliparum TaxID=2545692 RepID=A0A520KSA2_METT2|nr:MAG: UMP kinase [Candidatus Methanoliparum thermophilum]BDC35907.1 uridylate kinase [Candidatus Methanoliparum sp. LAM-1]
MKIVISIGGSILINDLSSERIKRYTDVIYEISKDNKVFIVVGGGHIARRYIKVAKDLGLNNSEADYIGIDLTRINAKLLISALPEESVYNDVALNFKDAKNFSTFKDIVVMGGTEPGHTTDAVGAILAEYVSADMFINATSVDGVYDKDPNRYKDAKKIDSLTTNDLMRIIGEAKMDAGLNMILDILAIKVIERSNIKTYIIDGRDPKNILRAVNGEEIGTRICL